MSYHKKQELLQNSFSSNEQNIHNRSLHQQYFENLEHKLIVNSHKLSNYIGTSYSNKMHKANSLNFDQKKTETLQNDSNKINQSSELSPSKKRFNQQIILNKQKLQVQIDKKNQLKNAENTYQKLLMKLSLYETKHKISILNNAQRNIAYNYDFISPVDILTREKTNQQKIKEEHQKILLKAVLDKKQKMSETISTTSSFENQNCQFYFNTKKHEQTAICYADFQIIKQLGEGKFGIVHLARHIKTNFICALKKIPQKIDDQCILEQLIRQIKIHSFLDHPNIAQLYTFFMENHHIYLVMQLCYSGNVYTLLRKQGQFHQQKVKCIIKQICHALEYLHEQDVIHRDIKPENILFHENIAKLCDFGWSVYAPLSRGTLCGTPIYASPELVMKKQYNSKIDVWNIGIFTYQLLYGKVPFEIRCSQDLYKVIEEQIYFPKSIDVGEVAKDFIRQCLNKNHQFRVSIMKLLDHEFIYQKEGNNPIKK